MSSSGSGPALKYNGANVTAGEFGSWTPIGAVQTASGYDVAWKNTSTGQYTVVDHRQQRQLHRKSGRRCAVAGNSYALESLEPIFGQDLNGDGVIGLYACTWHYLADQQHVWPAHPDQQQLGLAQRLNSAAADSASVTFSSSTGTLRLDHSSTFTGRHFRFHRKRQALWLRSHRSEDIKYQLH